MSRKETFQAIAAEIGEAKCTMAFETKVIPLKFANSKELLSFLPLPNISDEDSNVMLKLLKHWKKKTDTENSATINIDDETGELQFDTNVVFSTFKRVELIRI